jgi:hypothetical protein
MCCRNFFFFDDDDIITALRSFETATICFLSYYIFLYFSLTLIIISYQIGFNIDHDTTSGSLGGAQPRVRWQTDDISIGGLFDLQVRIVDIGCVFSDVDNNNEE